MIGLDTNVLIRFLVADDEPQARKVQQFLIDRRNEAEPAFIPHIVLCETEWVLRSGYEKSKNQILRAFLELLDSDVFFVQEKDVVQQALESWRTGPGNFSDYLIGHTNVANGCRVTVTFDRALRKSTTFFEL